MNELALFAGIGGGILGGKILGWRTVAAVERDAYGAAILAQRQNDGAIPVFPIWSDVETFDPKPWKGVVEIVSAGFPCQDVSVIGTGGGVEAERSGLVFSALKITDSLRSWVWLENSPNLTNRGIEFIFGRLAEMGYDAEWGCISAENSGAPHERKRIWILAYPAEQRLQRFSKTRSTAWTADRSANEFYSRKWPVEPAISRVVNGVAYRVERIKALGNAQVPRVVATAWNILNGN